MGTQSSIMTSTVLYIYVLSVCCIAGISAATCRGSYSYQNGEWCYAYVSEAKTWSDAETVCQALGGYLVEIKTEEQNRYVEGILYEHPSQNINTWLGATDLIAEDKWYWATSDTKVSDSFTYWGPNEPNGHTVENCMSFYEPLRRWIDHSCDIQAPFICQKDAES